MDDDRTLLELVAMAAVDAPSGISYASLIGRGWNPLTDDGDALRLAIKLEMSLNFSGDLAEASGMGSGGNEYFYERSPDKADAARRAIVKVAAEIGRNMRRE